MLEKKEIKITVLDFPPRLFPRLTSVAEVLAQFYPSTQGSPIVAAYVNHLTTSLSYRLDLDAKIIPIPLDSREGVNIYRRSLCFLLAFASKMLFPTRRLIIGHSLGKGYYYEFDGLQDVSKKDLHLLNKLMLELVAQDLPIRRFHLGLLEALDYFRKAGEIDTARLLEYRSEAKVAVSACAEFLDLFHGPLVPSTKYLSIFELYKYASGFILRYPPVEAPLNMAPFEDNPLLFSIYREHKRWGKILKINCIGLLNEKISSGQIKDFIEIAEALHEKKIAEIADEISQRFSPNYLVLIAGPSSSGKTTFAKKLSIQLKVLGYQPLAISLDDYYLPRLETPRDEEGNFDFESLYALDLKRLNQDLLKLMSEGRASLPQYDFIHGIRRTEEKQITLLENAIIILEGIHGLNDELTSQIKAERKFKIYVSALTQLNLDDHNRIPTTDVRLLRRIVRDNRFRGHSALATLKMWPSVRRGEDQHIFPFQNNADTAFNSSLDYELAVLKVYVEPLLKTIKPDVPEYAEAQRLLSFLNNVVPLAPTWVPSQSILREFIGESSFSY